MKRITNWDVVGPLESSLYHVWISHLSGRHPVCAKLLKGRMYNLWEIAVEITVESTQDEKTTI